VRVLEALQTKEHLCWVFLQLQVQWDPEPWAETVVVGEASI